MAIQSRNSVLAVLVETTEGTPVPPSAATDFIAIQDDFTMSPEFAVLENAELTGSLGPSKSILGIEQPSASFSHYLRHSGTEGQAPGYGDLLEAAFGNEDVEATEYDTIAGSTTTAVKVDTGEGTNFRPLQALLIKDGTNGYSIRPIESISSDDLELLFAVATAPGTGVNLGKAVTYYPAETGHQTLSIWNYVGNSGAIQLMAGSRVTDFSVTIDAGELINASYTLEGVEYFYDPIEIEATDIYLDFTDDDGTFAAQITAQMYKTPHDLAEALTTAMNGTATTETHSVTYSDSTGKFTIENTTGATLSLLWSTGANTANTVGDKIGFTVSADDTGALTYTSDDAQDYSAPYTPSFDSADPLVAKDNLCMIGDQEDYECFEASSVGFSMSTPKRNIESICAESGVSGSIINSREISITVSALLNQYDVDKFQRFKENTTTRFAYIAGKKSGGNWQAGKCLCLASPSATITSFALEDDDGLVSLSMTLSVFVNSDGDDEAAISFV